VYNNNPESVGKAILHHGAKGEEQPLQRSAGGLFMYYYYYYTTYPAPAG